MRPDVTSDPLPLKTLPIFYILDISKNMEGSRIEYVNRAIEKSLDELNKLNETFYEYKIKVAIIQYNDQASLITENGPEFPKDVNFKKLKPSGTSKISTALNKLAPKLTNDSFFKSESGCYRPIFIFITDGLFNDDSDELEKAIKNINQNKWFTASKKFCFALGDKFDKNLLTKITGDRLTIMKPNDLGLFERLVRLLSLSAPASIYKREDLLASYILRKTLLENYIAPEEVGLIYNRVDYENIFEYNPWDDDDDSDWEN